MTLAAYVLRTYAVVPTRAVEYAGGMARHKLRQVVDYIMSNLAEDNGL